ncbi:MAG TPA: ATP-binding protein [Nitrolancea sp.]|nr:ATP-binding protein [Nitrolancea sp.]
MNVELENTLKTIRNLLQADLLLILTPATDGSDFAPVAALGVDSAVLGDCHVAIDGATLQQLVLDQSPKFIDVAQTGASCSPLSRVENVASLASVPLVLHEQVLGILQVATLGDCRLDEHVHERLGFAAELATLALERSALQREIVAEQRATTSIRERMNFLSITSAVLSSSLDYETTLGQVAGMLVPMLADVCAVVLMDEDGSVNQVTTDGIDPQITRLVRDMQTRYSLRPDSPSAVRRVLDGGKTEYHPYVDENYIEVVAANEENTELLKHLGMRSMVIVPLNVRGKTIGALSVAFVRANRRYTPEEVDLIEELAQRAAIAVENARLFNDSQRALAEREEALRSREETLESERAARARAESAQLREAFLAEASNVLSMSLDYSSTLKNLTRLVVPRIADWFTIDLLDDAGALSTVALAHAVPECESLLRQLTESFSPALLSELPPRHVLRYRKPALISTLADGFWGDSAVTPEHLTLFEEIQTTSLMVIPLFSRDRTLGVMVFGKVRGSVTFDHDDFGLAVDLGYRIALAVDNSQLYHSSQEVLRLQEEFISTASHELKTPLTTVKGYLQIINRQLHREDQSPARIGRFIREMEQQVRRLEELVSDLLDVSRIQQGRVELRLEQFDITELAANVLSRFEFSQERTINHDLVLEASEPVNGIWDRGRIDQVLTNLISNAVKYSPAGGDVLLRIRQVADFVQITVHDSGVGMTREERRSLFQPFVRGENVRHEISGTGLGLYITRRIVQNHRGSISVKSEPGRGSTFTIRLPMVTHAND